MTIIIIDLLARLGADRPPAARPAVPHCQPTVGQQDIVLDREFGQFGQFGQRHQERKKYGEPVPEKSLSFSVQDILSAQLPVWQPRSSPSLPGR